ncbi:hypothetical protein VB715_08050 [Crocosphaera sp. UHCC 0190]|uniref:hypothetical protein n=1 Tax=Crocosphaera sp. UHCC 0190 TaxID=3110246 RepID=UPI002B20CA7F|nr:hypothetical protein [Crocosphaera sp. UHCC 0190]MEA5509714.1 hypothetical protein [Crocosphaera sp. UHCC 0190]
MLNKLLRRGKKEEFFLELDESKGVPPAEVSVTAATETPAPQAEIVAVVVEEESTKAEGKKKSKKTSVKKAAKKQDPKPEVVAPMPVVVKKQEPQEVEFATKFFMVPTSRRRPGPSLNTFKTMARQVKTPRG